ncbi:hypothetical protein [Tumebacillus flagellatus]|uniref:Uncharacterized protein n=1 Tax=Tumebacillus flagellatus TaxID=1157490 RepID=A0A074LQ87_9BACL|nr:hypothetical protein [Tumebacillus flagellatus]KEO82008.1 hypothetical protein EL26_17720 [Tumebacillus flagellatus]
MIWNYESLWGKTKLFMARAQSVNPDDSLFPFWSSLGLELLARATLSFIHPVLNADKDDSSILYPFGFVTKEYVEKKKGPKSIAVNQVFSRLKSIVPEFTETEEKFCNYLMDRRNEEIHSGSLAYEEFTTSKWVAKFYRVCKMLLSFQEKSLDELFGAETAIIADKMIEALGKNVETIVKKRIAEANSLFDKLTESDKEEAKRQAAVKYRSVYNEPTKKMVTCPACGSQHAMVKGEIVGSNEPRFVEGNIVETYTILPTTYACFSCQLSMTGNDELYYAELGGQYAIEEIYDPTEYYGPDDREDYYEDYYGDD